MCLAVLETYTRTDMRRGINLTVNATTTVLLPEAFGVRKILVRVLV
jgi:hypothetical protein